METNEQKNKLKSKKNIIDFIFALIALTNSTTILFECFNRINALTKCDILNMIYGIVITIPCLIFCICALQKFEKNEKNFKIKRLL